MSFRVPQGGLSIRIARTFAAPGRAAAEASNANGVLPPSW